MGFKIDITGDVNDIINRKTRLLLDQVEEIVFEVGNDIVNDAKRLAPVDESKLRNSITYAPVKSKNQIKIDVIAATNYAAYIEFGTRGFAQKYVSSLPKEWKDFAARFKGKGGGSFDEFVMRLTRWVRMKKIGATYDTKTRKRVRQGKQSAATTDAATAYAIALHIMRKGIRPQPFLYPAINKNLKKMRDELKKLR